MPRLYPQELRDHVEAAAREDEAPLKKERSAPDSIRTSCRTC